MKKLALAAAAVAVATPAFANGFLTAVPEINGAVALTAIAAAAACVAVIRERTKR